MNPVAPSASMPSPRSAGCPPPTAAPCSPAPATPSLLDSELASVTAADLILRVAYQMGKTPLLPLFAAALGAGTFLVGVIASVSTATGVLLKPLFGWLSDRWGRRRLLLMAAVLLTGTPLVYLLVRSPAELFATRLVHGLGTAMLGPASVALVAGMSRRRVAERLGWFGMARGMGYVLGPLLGAALLLELKLAHVYAFIGLLSALALVPLSRLPQDALAAQGPAEAGARRKAAAPSPWQHARRALAAGSSVPALWLCGAVEVALYAALYALKAFLPLTAVGAGMSVLWVGAFFAVQEGAHLLLKPWGGRFGDRGEQRRAIILGLVLVGLALGLLGITTPLGLAVSTATPTIGLRQASWLVLALLLGAGQALITPTTTALVSLQLPAKHLGGGLGLAGSLRNLGKVMGPVLAGLFIVPFGYSATLVAFGLALGPIALLLIVFRRRFVPAEAAGQAP